ncbi:MAG TPA: shikimate dehydrogenase [Usitatibacter sp.]|nr:shikimate dehydrogenase [Usitatibacter sp.]
MDRYVVIGNPVAHSLSPRIQALFAGQLGESLDYSTLLAPLGEFAACARAFFDAGGRGANVTLPFKIDALRFASKASDRARLAGAANFLASRSGTIEADNTDGAGLVTDLAKNQRMEISGSRMLILGAGGAARGVIAPLLAQGPSRLVIANRSHEKARDLAARFASLGSVESAPLDAIPEGGFDIVVNATSTSVRGETIRLPQHVMAARGFAYDMAYGKSAHAFLEHARAGGMRAADGLGMLVEQAAESFELWRGKRPDTAPVLAQLRSGLA